MGSHSQPGGSLVIGALEADRSTAGEHHAIPVHPPTFSPRFSRVGPSSSGPWQGLGEAEQKAFVALMAELAMRAFRSANRF